MADQPLVLVTGASGFIALHCIVQLLEAGYTVRGTLRTPAREGEVRETVARQVDAGDRLSFATADLTADDGWAEAAAGCRFALHVASPFVLKAPKDENDLIVPARDGTLRVLRAAAEAGVERVVMTSSIVAIAYGHGRSHDGHFDETDWSNLEGDDIDAYGKSKTIAERAAWDFVAGKAANGLELVAINPGVVFGSVLNADPGTSAEIIQRLMTRQLPACPRICFGVVDVRDVAAAHLAAMTAADAAGRRFCCVNGTAWIVDIANALAKHYNHRGYRVPTRRMPDWLFRAAALFDPTLRLVVKSLGKKPEFSSKLIRDVLDWQPRSLEEMSISMADSLIEHKVINGSGRT